MNARDEASKIFSAVAAAFAHDPRVAQPATTRGAFGSNGLRCDGRIFAMLVRGALVVKLRRARVEELIASGGGEAFRASEGRVMREWVTVEGLEQDVWLRLAREAHVLASAGVATRTKRRT